MLEIKPFTPADLDVITEMAREQDFAPGVGDIEIYANTDRQGIWLAEDPVMASLLLNNAIDRHKGVVLIDTPGHNPTAKTITTAKGFKPMGSTVRMYKGPMPEGHDRNVYGLACLELG